MAYLYEKENQHWVNWNRGSNLIYPFYEYAPGETLRIGIECHFLRWSKIGMALLDTEAQYSVIGEEIYAVLSQTVQPTIEIRLVADLGEDLNLETNFFISDEWTDPTVLGFSTLSQMRMALDPFYPNPVAELGRIFLVVSSIISLGQGW